MIDFDFFFSFQVQSFSNDEHSPEPMDMLRFSPMRTNRYSMPFAPPSYSSITARESSGQIYLLCFAFTSTSVMVSYVFHQHLNATCISVLNHIKRASLLDMYSSGVILSISDHCTCVESDDLALCVPPDSAQRGLAPCPAKTAVMRNPVYTAWSHEIQTNNCPPAPSSSVHTHSHTRCTHLAVFFLPHCIALMIALFYARVLISRDS